MSDMETLAPVAEEATAARAPAAAAEEEEGEKKSGLSTAARRKVKVNRAKHSKRFLALEKDCRKSIFTSRTPPLPESKNWRPRNSTRPSKRQSISALTRDTATKWCAARPTCRLEPASPAWCGYLHGAKRPRTRRRRRGCRRGGRFAGAHSERRRRGLRSAGCHAGYDAAGRAAGPDFEAENAEPRRPEPFPRTSHRSSRTSKGPLAPSTVWIRTASFTRRLARQVSRQKICRPICSRWSMPC